MQDKHKTKNELIKELSQLRSKVADIERAKNEYIQTEKILKASEKKYRSLVEVASDLILELDPEGNYLFVGPRAKNLLGYEPHEMLGKSPLDFMPPLEAERVEKVYNEFVKSKVRVFNSEHTFLHKNGQEVIVESNGLPVLDETGKMLGYRGICRDITKRRQAEEAMRKQALMIDQAYDSIISTDLNGNVTSWNKGAEKIFGYSANEALGRHISFIYPDDQHEILQREVIVPLKQKGKHEAEAILRRKSGQNFYGLLALSLLKAENGTVIGMLGSTMDITERKNSEIALLKSEDKFSKAFHSGSVIMIISTVDEGRFIDVNDEFLKVLGYSKEEIIGKTSREINIFKDYKQREYIGREIQEKGFIKNYEIHIRTKNDELRFGLVSMYPIEIDNEKYLLTTANDITERKLAEEELHRYECIVSNSHDMLALLDKNFTYLAVNESYLEPFGLNRHDVTGHCVSEVFGESFFNEKIKPNAEKCLAGNDVHYQDWFDFPVKGRRYMDVGYFPYKGTDNEIKGFVVNGRDITESKEGEIKLKESEHRIRTLIEHTTDAVFCYEYNPPIPIDLSLEEQVKLMYSATLMECNDVCARSYGAQSSKEVLGRKLTDLFGTSFGSLDKLFTDVVKNNYSIIDGEGVELLKDGIKRYFLNNGYGVIENDKLVRIWGTFRDITDRKQAEEALRESEKFNRAVIERSPMGVSVRSRTGKLLHYNEAWKRIWSKSDEAIQEDMTRERGRLNFTKKDEYLGEWQEKVRDVYEQGGYLHIPDAVRLNKKERGCLWVSQYFYAIKNDQGEVDRVVILTEDITDRKQAEEALRESEERFRDLAEMLPEAIFETDRNLNLTFANRHAFELFGYLKEDSVRGLNGLELIAVEDRERAKANMVLRLKGGDPGTVEYRALKKDGSTFPILFHANSVIKDGELIGIRGIIVDITERKRAEEALRQSEEKYRGLFLNSLGGIGISKENQVIDANPALLEIFGYDDLDEFKKIPLLDHVAPESRDLIMDIMRKNKQGASIKERFVYQIIRKDGEKRDLEISLDKIEIKNEIYVIGTFHDLTDRLRAEEALRESEVKYRAIVTAFDGLIYTCSQDCRVEFINQHYIEKLGFDPTGQLCYKALQGRDEVCPWCASEKVYLGETVKRERKSEKDGRWYYIVNTPIKHADGTVSKQSLIIDITDRKLAEKALEEERDFIARLTETSPIGITTIDVNGVITFANHHAEKLLGLECDDISGLSYNAPEWRITDFEGNPYPDEKLPFSIVVNTKKPVYDIQHAIEHTDGRRVFLSINAAPILNESGEIEAVVAAIEDITERKLAEEELRERQEMISALIETSKDWIWAINLESVHTFCNPAIEEILGYRPDELVGKNSFGLIHEDDRQLTKETVEKCVADNCGWSNLLIRWRHKDGSWRYLESNSVPIFNAKGETTGFRGVDRDITERIKYEEALKDERDRAQKYLDIAGVMFVALNCDANVVLINKKGCQILGYDENEIIGKNWFDNFLPENMRETVKSVCTQLVAGEMENVEYYENRILTKDGQEKLIAWHNTILKDDFGNIIGTLSSGEDITDRKLAEKALRESQERYRAIWENSPTGISLTDRDGIYHYVNPAYCRIYGFSKEQLINQSFFKLIIRPGYVIDRNSTYVKNFDKGMPIPMGEMEFIRSNGKPVWIQFTGDFVRENNVPKYLVSMNVDITERKLAEEALKESEVKLRKILDSSPDAITVVNLKGDIIDCNPATCFIHGFSQEELIGTEFVNLVTLSHKKLLLEYIDKCAKGENVGKIECMLLKKDDSEFPADLSANVINDAAGKPQYIMGITRDLTEQKKLEAQLIHSQRMESVGRLAGGVAHDFNNLLTAIIGHSELIESGLKSNDPFVKDIKVIQQASDRAAQLTSQLLAFSRKQTLQPKIVDLNRIIDNMLSMLKRIIGEDIDFNTLLGHELWAVKVDPGQMEQVIVNLAVNARDAMLTGGILTIKTRNVEITDIPDQVKSAIQASKYVLLSVSDTGSGMSEEVKANIFEPFFTTKKVGKGTGLGLSTVYGIISQSGGQIMFESNPGAGTVFNIYLPAAEGQTEMVETAPSTSEIPEGRESILVVEDDEIVRGIAVETLKRIGFNVIEASSGSDALALCARLDKPVDLVITDVIMPIMSGPEFIEKLKNIWPEFQMLYISGYAENDLSDQGTIAHYLQKPFHPKSLVQKVRRILDSQHQESLNYVLNKKID